MPGKIVLTVAEGPIRGQAFNFEEHDTFIFGRGSDCHARLSENDTTASRHHFILEVNPPDARIRDLGSLNGTHVNGVKYGGRQKSETPQQGARRRYPEVDLKHGDRIQVGETVFEMLVELPAREVHRKHEARCTQCGNDVSAEVAPGRYGDYVCQTCRSKADSDPYSVLQKILEAGKQPASGSVQDIQDYEIGKMIGQGGMGAVYLARRKANHAVVAIKVMLSRVAVDDRARQGFQREIDVTRSLRHPNIVELMDHGSAGSCFYFVMEFCPGGNLQTLMDKRGGKLSIKEAGTIIAQALEGLAHAHENNFVHRDLKPHNILIDGNGTPKITDFGLAKNFDKAGLSGYTTTGTAGGTPEFMPREQLTNFKYVKPVSDVWSMGASLYYLLTRYVPLDFPPDQDPIEIVLRSNVVSIRDRDRNIPQNLADVIDRSLLVKTKDRYQNAIEFRDALLKVL